MSTPALRNKPLKIEPTPRFPDIILSLNLIATTPPRFHWLIFIPTPGQGSVDVQQGLKLHAIQLFRDSGEVWEFESADFTLATSASVAAAAIIGQLKDMTAQQLSDFLGQIPMTVPDVDKQREPVFSCRVWIREALRHLHGAGIIHCPDVDALEKEMWEYGVPAAEAVENETFAKAKLVQARNSCTP